MYYIVSVATNIFDVIVTFLLFNSLFSWKTEKVYYKIFAGIFMFSATLANNLIVDDSVTTILVSIGVLMCVTIALEGRLTKKLLVVCGYMLLVILADIIGALLLVRFINTDVNTLLNVEGNARMMGMIITKPILLIMVKILTLCINRPEFKQYGKSNILLLAIPVLNIILLITIVRFFDNVQIDSSTPVYISSLCILFNTILVFYLFERIMGMALLKNKYDILENQIIMQEKQDERSTEEKNKLKSIFHDLKIHFQALFYLINNKHYEQAEQYLKDTDMVEYTNCNNVHTGNAAIDAIFNSKIYEAEQQGIETHIDCLMPQDILMSDIDICILFGNLLDNAIEGCLRAKKFEKRIDIYIRYHRNRLSCFIKNTSEDNIRRSGDSFISSKSDKKEHGVGIYNIKNIVLKYEGICKMSNEKGFFETYMTLFC